MQHTVLIQDIFNGEYIDYSQYYMNIYTHGNFIYLCKEEQNYEGDYNTIAIYPIDLFNLYGIHDKPIYWKKIDIFPTMDIIFDLNYIYISHLNDYGNYKCHININIYNKNKVTNKHNIHKKCIKKCEKIVKSDDEYYYNDELYGDVNYDTDIIYNKYEINEKNGNIEIENKSTKEIIYRKKCNTSSLYPNMHFDIDDFHILCKDYYIFIEYVSELIVYDIDFNEIYKIDLEDNPVNRKVYINSNYDVIIHNNDTIYRYYKNTLIDTINIYELRYEDEPIYSIIIDPFDNILVFNGKSLIKLDLDIKK